MNYVILPCFNEENSIENVLMSTLKLVNVDKIIMVDDGSIDSSFDIAFALKMQNEKYDKKLTIVRSLKNNGKGYSIRKGIKFISDSFEIDNNDSISMFDTDGERSVDDLGKMIGFYGKESKSCNKRDFVIIGERRIHRSFIRNLLNKVCCWFLNSLRKDDGLRLNDCLSGSYTFSAKYLVGLFKILKSRRFEIETELLLNCLKDGLVLKSCKINVPKISSSKVRLKHINQISCFYNVFLIENLFSFMRTSNVILCLMIFLICAVCIPVNLVFDHILGRVEVA